MTTTEKKWREKQMPYLLVIIFFGVLACVCDSQPVNAAPKQDPANVTKGKIKFRPYHSIDRQLDGMPVNRISIPKNWKANSSLTWDLNAYYMPVKTHIRAEAPDGGSWVEFYGPRMFWWSDTAHDRGPWGLDRSGAIHQHTISLPEAMVRYVIAPNRRHMKNLRILGYRSVDNIPKAFPHIFPKKAPKGKGICVRVQYEVAGSLVDEEFYGFMPPTDAIPSPPSAMEYHSYLYLTHSIGAKSGKLEPARPLLGFIATSFEVNPAWQQRFNQIHDAQLKRAAQNLAQSWASIERAKQMSKIAHESNEAFLQRAEASRAQGRARQNEARASYSVGSDTEFDKRSDNFDQYVRGTEHMVDQNGVVSDQYSDYNYHWTDGFGRYAHTDDQNIDPNNYLNGNYQQMKPLR
ncbi:MAG: hypothetical protein WC799_20270 [Desulfobacteraceae bacterium]|jgi:hypothetical protein